MPITFKKIASTTVGAAGTSNITFDNIPQSYTDLACLISLKSARNTEFDYPYLRFNNSSTNLTQRYSYGNGSTYGTATDTDFYWVIKANAAGSTTAGIFSNDFLYISNYTSSNNKAFSLESVTEHNGTGSYMSFNSGLWSNSASITKIDISNLYSTVWVQHSSATLYGIKRA